MFPDMSSESYHEPIELLSEDTKNTHRAIVSLKEELEAIDWYQQRAEACTDDELRSVLIHNKNEEVEHAMMTLEWLRRNSPVFSTNIGTYIGSSGPITEVEKNVTSGGAAAGGESGTPSTSLGIGSLKGTL
jgi:ferritin-like protein